ncbi:chromate efflux transporter [Vibrio sp. V27_P1S3P104]|uniref:chromate efflux transporter n=1 Tax=unclassified Vibrio TaxID=2614977 RepID=UPI001372F580|nr:MULTISPECIES: chromate efflux transporter [unclassified Vibrio]NAW70532.1 chromate efflux transporter [Vibrio sp. V28_P6S34P95]NAX05003.1 chromate efflux transporter [Vibrio sp. V30_P3S12P165]NAX35045.1 chromate efflux transporter [Vibrio sp. V29_P1S30P107]NAX36015.1 chromate efflux transporter [Vibrio sp. V27_P1S3P104]
MWEIFKTFFILGWICFGGPAAHIGYFRQTFVAQRQWLSDQQYAQLVALSQFLPGPGSSQVGFAIGYQRGGLIGASLAFLGFTLPSIFLMLLLVVVSQQWLNHPLFDHLIHGLKLLAVLVVADATWGMYQSFCRRNLTHSLCLISAVTLLLFPGIFSQIGILIFAAMVGMGWLQKPHSSFNSTKFSLNWWPMLLFAALFIGLPWLTQDQPILALFETFFYAGSLVFGGGHVVMPLLQGLLADQISTDTFLTGYAAAQAVPGPMFTLATYLGGHLFPDAPIWGSLIATAAIFLPGFLLLLSVLKNWQTLSNQPLVSGALSGVNAAVVGLLLAALYQPVFISSVLVPIDAALLIIGYGLWKIARWPILGLVGFYLLCGLGLALIG